MSEAPVEGASRQVFSPTSALAIVLVGIFAFSAFVTLLAYAPDLQRDVVCRSNVYSKCAVGFAALSELVRDGGAPTVISRTKLPAGRTEGLLIVTPEAAAGPGTDAGVSSLGFSGPTLVVLPKWDVQVDPDHLSWGRKVGLVDPGKMPQKDILAAVKVARAKGVARPVLNGLGGTPLQGLTLTPGPIDSLQTLTAKDWIPTLTDGAGDVVLAQVPSSNIYVLSDPDLLNTQGLANLDTLTAAVTLLRALRAGEGPVMFDVTLNGYEIDRSSLKLMFNPPFLAVTLCIAAALALAGLQALFRFGAVRRAGRVFALGKEALTDNSAQLIRMARREAKMAPRYAALTRAAVSKAVAAPRDLTGEPLTLFLDRLGRQRGAEASLAELEAEAGRVGDRKHLLGVARRLYRWRLEMTRERG
jgi:hypothetical protein